MIPPSGLDRKPMAKVANPASEPAAGENVGKKSGANTSAAVTP
jgi:hypothetical protein